MLENRVQAIAEFLKVVPETIRLKGRKHQDRISIEDQGQRILGRLPMAGGKQLELQFDFDPKVFSIVGAHCGCQSARKGSVCEHICGFASQLVEDHFSLRNMRHSLEFLDKHFNAPAFQNSPFRLSVELEATPKGLEPSVFFHKYLKDENYGGGRKFTANDSYKFTQGDPTDQNLLDYIKSFRQILFYSNYETSQRFNWGFWLSLLAHPRVFYEKQPIEVVSAPINPELLTLDGAYHLRISHEMELDGEIKYYEVSGGLLGLCAASGKLLVSQADKFRRDILKEIGHCQPVLTRSELINNLSRLEKLRTIFDLRIPEDLKGIIQKGNPELVLQLNLEVGKGFLLKPRIRYQGTGCRVAPGSLGQYLTTEADDVIERNPAGEEACYEEFLTLFPYEEKPDHGHQIHVMDLERAFVLIDWLKEQDHWPLEWQRKEPRVHRIDKVEGLKAQVDGNAWLKLHIMGDGETFSIDQFPDEDQFLAETHYVAVDEGEWLEIDNQLRTQLNRFKMAASREKRGMKLKGAALALVGDMEHIEWEGDGSWLDKIRAWRGGESKYKPDERLKAELRNYQTEGYRWLRRMSDLELGACLADDMGLGKTVQALAVAADRLEQGPLLVVAPASVCFNWKEEIQRFLPHVKVQLYAEGRRSKNLTRLKPGHFVIISYVLVLKDFDKLKTVDWGTLILDEAQFIKNALSQRALAVSKLKRRWTLALTGTPLENHLGELWSIFRMLNPELLGGWEQFRKKYVTPVKKKKCDPQALEHLRRLIQPFILRRTKQNVLTDLPARSDILLKVVMSETQRSRYEHERRRILKQLDDSEETGRFKLLAAITRLRQLACHPLLCEDKYKGESAKLIVLSELVEELVEESHRVLVFSQFTSFLGLIALELNRIHIPHLLMTGETPVKHRQGIIKRFQKGEAPVFLVSLRAGGTGLNLTNANYVIHMDPWWNPAVEDQATDRAHRIGQTQAVTVYRLLASNTIEESILAIHDRKKELVRGLLTEGEAAANLSVDDLVALIRK